MKRKVFAIVLAFFIGLCMPAGQLTVLAAGLPNVSAKAAILISSTGEVLYQKNDSEHLPMASTTKIMTALLTLEQPNLDHYFTVDENAIRVEGSSMGLQPGDQVTLRTLAYGMLLQSGNDAANAAAVRIGKTQEQFAQMMNQRAAELEMENTHFVTPSGLDDKMHYSTAADMAKLAQAALENTDFLEICSTYQTKVKYGNPPYERWMTNHNRLLKEYQGTIGVKTGFTKKSGRCLVSATERNGVRLIAVTLNCPNDWSDHRNLFDYGFSVLKSQPLNQDLSGVGISVVNGEKETAAVSFSAEPSAAILPEHLEQVERKLCLDHIYYAPVKQGDVVGSAEYWWNGKKIAEVPLLAAETVSMTEQQPVQLNIWDKCKLFFSQLWSKITSWM